MNYDKIIIAMMSRIQSLEEEVKDLKKKVNTQQEEKKVTTADIRAYIEVQKTRAAEAGKASLELRASEIHKGMHLKMRFPMVCNAMRQCMNENDEIIHETESGYSSSLEIRYFI